MSRFTYTARDRSGKAVSATLEAPNRKEAARLIIARGLQPLSVSETSAPVAAGKPAPKPAAPVRSGPDSARPARAGAIRLTRKQRLPFLQALSDLIASGLSAGEAVRLLGLRLKEPALRALCSGLWERLSEGQPLSKAMEDYDEVFDLSTINLIQAGEATGSLNEVLLRLIGHFTEQKEMRQKLLTALAYPAFICLVAFGVILFFIFFLLPRLQTLLTSLGGKLPWSTQLLVGISGFLIHYGIFVGIAGLFAGISFWRWRKTDAGRTAADAWSLRVPLLGPFLNGSTILDFSQTLSVLLENGVTTSEALRMTERVITNRTLKATFAEATSRVLEGESLSLSLAKTGWFPDLVLDRLSVGENTGNLVPSLKEIARTYQKDLTRRLQFFTSIISSGVLLCAFSFVAFIAYAIVSAVFSLTASFKF
jgi:type II secretory pathway component PulF